MKWETEGVYVRAFELERNQLELRQRIGGERGQHIGLGQVQRIGLVLGQHIGLEQRLLERQRLAGQCRSVNYKGFGGKENHKLVGQSEAEVIEILMSLKKKKYPRVKKYLHHAILNRSMHFYIIFTFSTNQATP